MAYTCESDTGTHGEIAQKLQDLLNGASITTLHQTGIVKIGTDLFIAFIVYE